MKKAFIIKIVLFIILFGSNLCFSGEKQYNTELEFGDSNAKKVLQINGNGNIDISGYNGDKVLISSDENIFGEDDEVDEKTKGLKKISSAGFNIINNKKENTIIILRPFDGIDLNIKVPNNMTLKLGNENAIQYNVTINQALKNMNWQFTDQELRRKKRELERQTRKMERRLWGKNFFGYANGIFDGDIYIKNFSGIIEVSIKNGRINAENIKGEANVSTNGGDINVSFKALNKDSALYFSSVSGEIDITLPKDIKADILARTLKGDVYSGFDGDIIPGNDMEDKTDESAFQNFFMNAYITTRINGGGDNSVYLNTMNSNIYIRKGK